MNDWISVKDKLPELDCYNGKESRTVIVWGVSGLWLALRTNYDGCGPVWKDTQDGIVLYGDEVTHWMPMPDPPQDDCD